MGVDTNKMERRLVFNKIASIVLAITISVIYLIADPLDDQNRILLETLIKGTAVIFVYLAYWCYKAAPDKLFRCVLLLGAAIIIPFAMTSVQYLLCALVLVIVTACLAKVVAVFYLKLRNNRQTASDTIGQSPSFEKVFWLLWLLLLAAIYAAVGIMEVTDAWRALLFWNRCLFSLWPVFLVYLSEKVKRQRNIARQTFLYWVSVLILVWIQTDFAYFYLDDIPGIEQVAYYMIMASLVYIKEFQPLTCKSETGGIREKNWPALLCTNGIAFLYTFLKNYRLRDVILKNGGSSGNWVSYRAAAITAFLHRDLTVLEENYAQEQFIYSVYGAGLTSIWFRSGRAYVMLLLVCLILLILALWRIGGIYRYLSVGIAIQTGLALVSEIMMFSNPWMGIPFIRTMSVECILLFLILYDERLAMNNPVT